MKEKGQNIPRNYNADIKLAIRAEGKYIIDEDGKRYFDGCSGALVNNLGYGVSEIIEAMYEQLKTINFAHPSRWRNKKTEEAASLLAEFAPDGMNHIWFVSGGSEAIESAIKLARQYYCERDKMSYGKRLIIGRWNSYHGSTIGCMAVSGNIPRRKIFSPMFMDHPKIPEHYCYRCPYEKEYPGCNLMCAEELQKTINSYGSENIAAFIAEPVVGSAVGALRPPDEYWPLVRKICTENDILLIADEIMTGMGRTGKEFCVNHWDIVPDIITSAKGITAGYSPAGGVIIRDEIMNAIKIGSGHFMHGHTYNANPVTAAAIVEVVKYIRANKIIENVEVQGQLLNKELSKLKSIPIVGDIRGIGLMYGIEIVADASTKETFPISVKASSVVTQECAERGLIVYPYMGMVNRGAGGDNLLIAPPLNVTEEEILNLIKILKEGLNAASDKLLK